MCPWQQPPRGTTSAREGTAASHLVSPQRSRLDESKVLELGRQEGGRNFQLACHRQHRYMNISFRSDLGLRKLLEVLAHGGQLVSESSLREAFVFLWIPMRF